MNQNHPLELQTNKKHWPLFLVLVVLLLLVAAEQAIIAQYNDWWVDELFSLWASDRNVAFFELLQTRIASDSNPPLYFSLLHGARLIFSQDRTAVTVLNFSTVLIGAASALIIAWRSRLLYWIILSLGLFVLGGPLAAYLPEARSYCLAMTASYFAVTLAALFVSDTSHSPGWLPFTVIGLIAGLSHVFSAILCCALAASMLSVCYFTEKERSRLPPLALGISATAATLTWMMMAPARPGDDGPS